MNLVALGLKLRELHAPAPSAFYPRSACQHSWESSQTNTHADICFLPEAWNLVIVTAVVGEYLVLRISLHNTLQEWIKAAITLNIPDCDRKVFANNTGSTQRADGYFCHHLRGCLCLCECVSEWMNEWQKNNSISINNYPCILL